MLTEFGKILRKLRVDHDERMIDMAKRINRSQGFLSAIERGRKPAPDGFDDVIIKEYGLTGSQVDDIKIAYLRSNIITLIERYYVIFYWDTAEKLVEFIDIYSLKELTKIHKCMLSLVEMLRILL